jgi:hypothetical protein
LRRWDSVSLRLHLAVVGAAFPFFLALYRGGPWLPATIAIVAGAAAGYGAGWLVLRKAGLPPETTYADFTAARKKRDP